VVAGADRWDVAVGGARGPVAARLVALHVVERAPSMVPAAAVDAARGPATFAVTARIGVARGVQADDLAATVAGLEIAAAGRWWWSAGVEWQRGVTRDPDPGAPVASSLWIGRAQAGVTLGRVELGAGPLAGRLHVDTGASADAWLVGVGAAARARWPVGGGWSITASAGADAYRHRVEVRFGAQTVATTPRVAFSGGIGLSRELGR
jgi:hypothetical protein